LEEHTNETNAQLTTIREEIKAARVRERVNEESGGRVGDE
jgi:hypothetical protein